MAKDKKAADKSAGKPVEKDAKPAKTKANSSVTTAAQPATTPTATSTPATNPAVAAAILSGDDLNDDEIVLTDAEGRRYCRSTDCDQIGTVDGYCRYHYLFFWRKIQNRKKILADGKLERYIDELTSKYADKFVELLRKDLRTEKDFTGAIQELELDDTSQAQEEDDKTYLEEIRGISDDSATTRDDDF